MIDKNSPTWQSIEKFIKEKREAAVSSLISDNKCEQQRGALKLLEELEELGSPKPSNMNTPSVNY
ncbi:hypothetical protein [Endozoicomonas arenosclerae]|uniref:hypothetical protein n=1 Tax=Endozoicomonas arenosclerae TaxID=1633495 RepID=UPI000780CF27|nr:hypothetical protein [Endozoicomonas arenosclerae]